MQEQRTQLEGRQQRLEAESGDGDEPLVRLGAQLNELLACFPNQSEKLAAARRDLESVDSSCVSWTKSVSWQSAAWPVRAKGSSPPGLLRRKRGCVANRWQSSSC